MQVIEIIDKINPLGFNFVGGNEEKVGFKSFEDLDEIFDLLEIEEWNSMAFKTLFHNNLIV